MGDVLYIAPNIDKSLQYIGDSMGRSSQVGIIFHGDLLVVGTAGSDAARTRGANWTKSGGRFATEEIGLKDANTSFIIHHAYLIERYTLKKKKDIVKENTSFSTPIPIIDYIQEKGIKISDAIFKKAMLKKQKIKPEKLITEAEALLSNIQSSFYKVKDTSTVVTKVIDGAKTAVALRLKVGKSGSGMDNSTVYIKMRITRELKDVESSSIFKKNTLPFSHVEVVDANIPNTIYISLHPTFIPPSAKQWKMPL
jgi:hypothetical protein